ncbi:hypothetical protein BDV95DRAFT_638124 [Massariosphaeria phaeospora]|uniref:Uncharacterized protein n=1 Tax=Massariosphaeria phaeospora TaxID=100035 RepID=A0A7C8I9A1_9PLEO|nr:hypothetical protein BDV95DRAFT_638124 [Massariosphaeria phaeospora]
MQLVTSWLLLLSCAAAADLAPEPQPSSLTTSGIKALHERSFPPERFTPSILARQGTPSGPGGGNRQRPRTTAASDAERAKTTRSTTARNAAYTQDKEKPKDKDERYNDQKERRTKEFEQDKWGNWGKKRDKAKESYKAKKDEKEMKEKEEKEKKEKEEKDKKDDKKRKRAGWCWALMAEAGAWASADFEGVTEEEIEGLPELWPEDVPEPAEEEIPEWIFIKWQSPNTAVDGVVGSKSLCIENVPKPARPEGGKPSSKAVTAARNSNRVSTFLKDKRFQDCISATAGATATAITGEILAKSIQFDTGYGEALWSFTFDFGISKDDVAPAPRGENGGKQIRSYFGLDEDESGSNER